MRSNTFYVAFIMQSPPKSKGRMSPTLSGPFVYAGGLPPAVAQLPAEPVALFPALVVMLRIGRIKGEVLLSFLKKSTKKKGKTREESF